MRHHTTPHGEIGKRQNNDNKSSKEAQWQQRLTLIGVCSAICIRLKMQTLCISIQLIMIRRFIPILGHTLCSFRKDTIDFSTHTRGLSSTLYLTHSLGLASSSTSSTSTPYTPTLHYICNFF